MDKLDPEKKILNERRPITLTIIVEFLGMGKQIQCNSFISEIKLLSMQYIIVLTTFPRASKKKSYNYNRLHYQVHCK